MAELDLDALRARVTAWQDGFDEEAEAALARVVPALLAALEEARRTIQELLSSRDSWQRKHEEVSARAGQLHADLEEARQERSDALVAFADRDWSLQRERHLSEQLASGRETWKAKALEFEELLAASRAEVERMRPVVEAAQAYVDYLRRLETANALLTAEEKPLAAAVDTYEKTQESTE